MTSIRMALAAAFAVTAVSGAAAPAALAKGGHFAFAASADSASPDLQLARGGSGGGSGGGPGGGGSGGGSGGGGNGPGGHGEGAGHGQAGHGEGAGHEGAGHEGAEGAEHG